MASETPESREEKQRRQEAEHVQLARAHGLSVAEVREFREIFQLVDLDGNGSIDENEIMKLMKLLYIDENARESVEQLSKDLAEIRGESGEEVEMPFSDFVALMASKPQVDYTATEVLEAFRFLAGPHVRPGHISVVTLESALEKMAGGMPTDELHAISHKLDVDSRGCVHYHELVELLMGRSKAVTGPTAAYSATAATSGAMGLHTT